MEKYYLDDQMVEDIISKVPHDKQEKCFRELAKVMEVYADRIAEGYAFAPKEPEDVGFHWIDDEEGLVTSVSGEVIGKCSTR